MTRKKHRLKEKLKGILAPSDLDLLFNSYDIIGDIAVIKVPEKLVPKSSVIAKAIMETHRHVKTVLRQVTPISGELRLRGLEWIAGEKKTETVHKEFGCLFKVDLEKCYFSPRLLYERKRITDLVRNGEVVINMFAGVGCFSILIAKYTKVKKVYSIDINPVAIRYLSENAKLNNVEDIVEPIEGDSKEVILKFLRGKADRVLMPLPEKAYEYLDYAIEALNVKGGWIHYYDFYQALREENPVLKVYDKVSQKLSKRKLIFEIKFGRVVRTVGPRLYQVVLDIYICK